MDLFSLQAAVAKMCSSTSRPLSGPGCVRSTRDKPSSTRLRVIAAKSPQQILGSSSSISVLSVAGAAVRLSATTISVEIDCRFHLNFFLKMARRITGRTHGCSDRCCEREEKLLPIRSRPHMAHRDMRSRDHRCTAFGRSGHGQNGCLRLSRSRLTLFGHAPLRIAAVQNGALNPISPVANPCCNRNLVGVVLCLGEGHATTRIHQRNCERAHS
jgi:hypothetical protein